LSAEATIIGTLFDPNRKLRFFENYPRRLRPRSTPS
jgi:hypothetical protein